MRFFPAVVVASLLCWLAPAPARAQQLQCNPCKHDFGKVRVGRASTYSFPLKNIGNTTVDITSKSKYGHVFTFGNFPLPMKIQPGASVLLPVTFTPDAPGPFNGVLRLVSNSLKPPVMNATGTGVSGTQPQLSISPTSLNFGKVTVGSSASLPVTLTAANAAVTISSDGSSSSEFAIAGLTLPATIQPGTGLTITMQFAPNASGVASGQAGFTSNAENSPTVETLTGTGAAAGAHSVDLTWNPGDGNAIGYNIYRGAAAGGPYSQINTALDASTNYVDSTVSSGTTYYYVATEVNNQGQESAFSNVAQAVVPNP